MSYLVWVTFILLGIFAYFVFYSRDERPGGWLPFGLAKFVFPPNVYTHPSALVDYQIFLADRFLKPGKFLLFGLKTSIIAAWVNGLLADWLGPRPDSLDHTVLNLFFVTVLIAVLMDFCLYVNHYLQHKIPFMWEIHKVHHSAEVLTPITTDRNHPFHEVTKVLIRLAILAPIEGIVFYLFLGELPFLLIFGTNAVLAAFHLAGSNLRHSHIWIPYPKSISRVLCSPAMHQIHHSVAPQHRDKNFAEMFSLWDWVFGTIYIPEMKREELVFGLGDGQPQEHTNLLTAYWRPVRNIGLMCWRSWNNLVAKPSPSPTEPIAASSSLQNSQPANRTP